jgi:hemerythrin superfamily protein
VGERGLTHGVSVTSVLVDLSQGENAVDAIQFVLRDHREVERLFKELERATRAEELDRQAEVVRALVRELSLHATVEEQFVYPALRAAKADTRVLDALEEHHAVKVILAELENLPPTHERFTPKAKLLAENVRRHVAEEERELLPLLERSLDVEARRALGDALERARRAAPTRPHPTAPDEPPGNFVAGAVAAVYDRSRDALRGGAAVLRTLTAQGASRSVDGVKGLATRARRGSADAVNGALEQGRAAVDAGAERGREAIEGARAAAARVEVRGSQAARAAGGGGRRGAKRRRTGTAARRQRR